MQGFMGLVWEIGWRERSSMEFGFNSEQEDSIYAVWKDQVVNAV